MIPPVGMTEGTVRNERLWWASPIVFGPRIPDFLSRLVALSETMRLSLGESRIPIRG
jgi:hypothetical protein